MAETAKPGAANTPAEAPVEAPKPVTPPAEAPKPGDGQPKPGEAVAAPPVEAPKPKAGDPPTPKPAAAAATLKLTIPDNAKSWVDDSDVAMVLDIAKAQGLTQEEAQERLEQVADAAIESSARQLTEFQADKTYGGTNAEETQRLANLALDKLRPANHPLAARTQAALLKNGLGNNLLFISILADVGKMMREDSPALSTGAAISENTPMHERLYGKDKASS